MVALRGWFPLSCKMNTVRCLQESSEQAVLQDEPSHERRVVAQGAVFLQRQVVLRRGVVEQGVRDERGVAAQRAIHEVPDVPHFLFAVAPRSTAIAGGDFRGRFAPCGAQGKVRCLGPNALCCRRRAGA